MLALEHILNCLVLCDSNISDIAIVMTSPKNAALPVFTVQKVALIYTMSLNETHKLHIHFAKRHTLYNIYVVMHNAVGNKIKVGALKKEN